MRGIGDIGAVIANSVKVGALSIPKVLGSLDNLAVRGFITLEGFVVHTIPKAVSVLPVTVGRGITAINGMIGDIGHILAQSARSVGNFMVREFGGWKWLRIFLPVAAHEISAIGLGNALKLGVLGRGLSIQKYSGLAALSGGVRLSNGLTSVNVIKPGDAPHGGGFNFTPSGLHLPDLTERPIAGINASAFSAKSIDLAGMRNLEALDLAGINKLTGVGLAGAHGPDLQGLSNLRALDLHGVNGVNLGGIGKIDMPTIGATGGVDAVKLPSLGGLSAVTLPNMQIGNLGAGLTKFTNGIDGLSSFGRPEIRSLQTGDVSAIRISDSQVSFNLGAPEKSLGSIPQVQAGNLGKLDAGAVPQVQAGPIGKVETGAIPNAVSVNRAMDLLAGPGGLNGLKGLDSLTAHSAVSAPNRAPELAGVPQQIPRADQAGAAPSQQLTHLQALDQLKRAQDALAGASGDALSIARLQKDLNIAESLVKRTDFNIKIERPVPPARPADLPGPVAGADLHLDAPTGNAAAVTRLELPTPAAATSAHLDLPTPKPAAIVDEGIQALQARIERLRGDGPAPDLAGLDLQRGLEDNGVLDAGRFPEVPTTAPGDDLATLERRIEALYEGNGPRADLTDLELPYRLEQLRPSAEAGSAVPLSPAQFPQVPTLSPAEVTARSVAAERLTRLEDQLAVARAEEIPEPPAAHLDTGDVELQARFDALRRPGDDGLTLPDPPRTAPTAAPGQAELSVRLQQLTVDAKQAHLPQQELSALTADVKAALDEGRTGAAADGLIVLHDRIDRHIVLNRLDSFRAHIDAGHQRAAQLGVDKASWLQQAVNIERAAAAGRTDELHGLLNAYENKLADQLSLQKLKDLPPVPDSVPTHGIDEAGVPAPRGGDADDIAALQARLDELNGGPRDVDPELAGLELQARFEALRGTPATSAELPTLPDVPTSALDDAFDVEMRTRLDALRADNGMSDAERATWNGEFARAGDEATDAAVLDRFTERLHQLDGDARLAALREGPNTLPADEHRLWQDALARAGTDHASIDRVMTNYAARLEQFGAETGAKVGAALSGPDHLRPLNSRVDEGLSGLSKNLREQNAAAHTSLSDRIEALRGPDAKPQVLDDGGVPTAHTDLPAFPAAPKDLPTAPKDLPVDLPSAPKALPGDLPSTPKDLPTALKDAPGETPRTEAPKSEAPRTDPAAAPKPAGPGEQLAELPAPQLRPADDVVLPPRDLLGDGTPPVPSGRIIEVDAERWTPRSDAFRFEKSGDDQPPKVTRPQDSGERVATRYQLTATDDELLFTVKVHLDADPAIGAKGLDDVRSRTGEGVEQYLNNPGYRLPGMDQPMRVAVEFVDDPATAHAQVKVAEVGAAMNQGTWAVGAPPAAYAHEVVHFLGVKDVQAPADALLRSVTPVQRVAGDLMDVHSGAGHLLLDAEWAGADRGGAFAALLGLGDPAYRAPDAVGSRRGEVLVRRGRHAAERHRGGEGSTCAQGAGPGDPDDAGQRAAAGHGDAARGRRHDEAARDRADPAARLVCGPARTALPGRLDSEPTGPDRRHRGKRQRRGARADQRHLEGQRPGARRTPGQRFGDHAGVAGRPGVVLRHRWPQLRRAGCHARLAPDHHQPGPRRRGVQVHQPGCGQGQVRHARRLPGRHEGIGHRRWHRVARSQRDDPAARRVRRRRRFRGGPVTGPGDVRVLRADQRLAQRPQWLRLPPARTAGRLPRPRHRRTGSGSRPAGGDAHARHRGCRPGDLPLGRRHRQRPHARARPDPHRPGEAHGAAGGDAHPGPHPARRDRRRSGDLELERGGRGTARSTQTDQDRRSRLDQRGRGSWPVLRVVGHRASDSRPGRCRTPRADQQRARRSRIVPGHQGDDAQPQRARRHRQVVVPSPARPDHGFEAGAGQPGRRGDQHRAGPVVVGCRVRPAAVLRRKRSHDDRLRHAGWHHPGGHRVQGHQERRGGGALPAGPHAGAAGGAGLPEPVLGWCGRADDRGPGRAGPDALEQGHGTDLRQQHHHSVADKLRPAVRADRRALGHVRSQRLHPAARRRDLDHPLPQGRLPAEVHRPGQDQANGRQSVRHRTSAQPVRARPGARAR